MARSTTNYKRLRQAIVNEEKHRRGKCVDCGVPVPPHRPWLFEFDHCERHTKVNNLAKMCKSRYSIESIMEEMAKCELVCVWCHRIRTHERRDFVNLDQPTADIHPSLFDCDGLHG